MKILSSFFFRHTRAQAVSANFVRPAKSFLPWAFLMLLLATDLASCTTVDGSMPMPPGLEQLRWERFERLSAMNAEKSGPFNAVVNFRYKTPDDGYRLAAYIWSAGGNDIYPIRLDLQSGTGAIAAKLFEDGKQFLFYDAGNNEAYIFEGSHTAMRRMGIPVPFSLDELVLLLTGRYTEFFMPQAEAEFTEFLSGTRDVSRYHIKTGALRGIFEVDADGRPVLWTEESTPGWQVEFSYLFEANLPGPQTIRITHPDGYSALFQVRSFSPAKGFSAKQLSLTLPENIPVYFK